MSTRLLNVSTNPNWQGKPLDVKQPDGTSKFYNVDNKEIYIGYGWQNIEVDYSSLFELLTVNGTSIAPSLNPSLDKFNRFLVSNKCNANVKSHSLLMVDIDDGMTIEEMLVNPLYQHYGSGYYTTPNHHQDAPRFRIIFVLEEDIIGAADLATMYRWMIRYWGKADGNCIDASRSFNGSVDAARKEITTRTLPKEFVRRALLDQSKFEYKPPVVATDYDGLTEVKKNQIYELLTSKFVGKITYEEWIRFIWNLKSCGYSLAEVEQICRSRYGDSNKCKTLFDDNRSGNVGVIINLCKREHGDDCFM